jgi:ubiquinone/menaquinone biosynthesis C-methylase UbiE
MSLPFTLPPLLENGPQPLWTGKEFQIGNAQTKVLHYSTNNAGWNDELTDYHEDVSEGNHFIEVASRNNTIQQLKSTLKQPKPIILEVGCSSGFLLQEMRRVFPQATLIGSDIVYNPLLKLAERLPIPLLRFDILQCPLPDNCLDAITILNVLEHIEDDATALKQIHRILKPGGVLIIEVPAGPRLYDVYDKSCMHFRRYTLSNLCRLLKQKGFTLHNRTHLGVFIYPGFWLTKQKNKRFLSASEATQRQLMEKNIRRTGKSKILPRIMQAELMLGRFVSYPFGIRCLVTCTKQHEHPI